MIAQLAITWRVPFCNQITLFIAARILPIRVGMSMNMRAVITSYTFFLVMIRKPLIQIFGFTYVDW